MPAGIATTVDAAVCGGKPCVRGLRFSGLSAALGCLRQARRATGYSRRIPIWKPATIDEALKYAAFLAEDETIEHAK